MKLRARKLAFIPVLFEEHPSMLKFIFGMELTGQFYENLDTYRSRYTNCGCTQGKFYRELKRINQYMICFYGCDSCQNWSMEVKQNLNEEEWWEHCYE